MAGAVRAAAMRGPGPYPGAGGRSGAGVSSMAGVRGGLPDRWADYAAYGRILPLVATRLGGIFPVKTFFDGPGGGGWGTAGLQGALAAAAAAPEGAAAVIVRQEACPSTRNPLLPASPPAAVGVAGNCQLLDDRRQVQTGPPAAGAPVSADVSAPAAAALRAPTAGAAALRAPGAPAIAAVINLCQTQRYYDPAALAARTGAPTLWLPTPGHGAAVPLALVLTFLDVVAYLAAAGQEAGGRAADAGGRAADADRASGDVDAGRGGGAEAGSSADSPGAPRQALGDISGSSCSAAAGERETQEVATAAPADASPAAAVAETSTASAAPAIAPPPVLVLHCTHGINRTGFFAVLALMLFDGASAADAAAAFAAARGHAIERLTLLEEAEKRAEMLREGALEFLQGVRTRAAAKPSAATKRLAAAAELFAAPSAPSSAAAAAAAVVAPPLSPAPSVSPTVFATPAAERAPPAAKAEAVGNTAVLTGSATGAPAVAVSAAATDPARAAADCQRIPGIPPPAPPAAVPLAAPLAAPPAASSAALPSPPCTAALHTLAALLQLHYRRRLREESSSDDGTTLNEALLQDPLIIENVIVRRAIGAPGSGGGGRSRARRDRVGKGAAGEGNSIGGGGLSGCGASGSDAAAGGGSDAGADGGDAGSGGGEGGCECGRGSVEDAGTDTRAAAAVPGGGFGSDFLLHPSVLGLRPPLAPFAPRFVEVATPHVARARTLLASVAEPAAGPTHRLVRVRVVFATEGKKPLPRGV